VFILTGFTHPTAAYGESGYEGVSFPWGRYLNVPCYAQETDVWCWAAGGQMIMEHHGVFKEQCEQVNVKLGHGGCCRKPVPKRCLRGSFPDFRDYGFTVDETSSGTALSWEQLKGQIHQNKPAGFSWQWRKSDKTRKKYKGHYMVAAGYVELLGFKFVLVHDPEPKDPGNSTEGTYVVISYYVYKNGRGGSEHWKDHYNISK
ncbi:MAG: hypothetical protein GY940_22235, partial [bacterium]|nr:hypothetical protein [bacterium]